MLSFRSIKQEARKKSKSSALVFCHNAHMAKERTPRQLARERITADLIEEGRRQLAEHGAAGLSLRSVARELGMVSSAVYRYVDSRDDLLTRLIVEAYDSLGDAVEASLESSATAAPADRWVRAAHAVRDWALERPHEYFLIFGTPVPGYAAPEATAVAGTRASLALVRIVVEASERGQVDRNPGLPTARMSEELTEDFSVLRRSIEGGDQLSDDLLLAVLVGWTQMFGLVSFEVSNQTRSVVENHRDLFDSAVRLTAAQIGLAGAN